MNKLQRYLHRTDVGNIEYCLTSDVAALEAENERLHGYISHLPDCERWGYEGKMCGIRDGNSYDVREPCTCGLEAILNREQEKQP